MVSSPVPLLEQKNWLCHPSWTAHDTGNVTSPTGTHRRHCLQHRQEHKDLLQVSQGSSGGCRHPRGPGWDQGEHWGLSLGMCYGQDLAGSTEKGLWRMPAVGGRCQAAPRGPGKAGPGRAQHTQLPPMLVLAAGFHSNISLSKYLSAESSYQHV